MKPKTLLRCYVTLMMIATVSAGCKKADENLTPEPKNIFGIYQGQRTEVYLSNAPGAVPSIDTDNARIDVFKIPISFGVYRTDSAEIYGCFQSTTRAAIRNNEIHHSIRMESDYSVYSFSLTLNNDTLKCSYIEDYEGIYGGYGSRTRSEIIATKKQ